MSSRESRTTGEANVTCSGGNAETVSAGDLFYWPPGHTILITQDTEMVLFSPQKELCAGVAHVNRQLAMAP